jgi:starch phosphorylase
VSPSLPPALERLRELAYNLRWTWSHATIELFSRVDRDLWDTAHHNPVLLLGMVDQAALEAASADEGFLAHLEGTSQYFDAYMAAKSMWFHKTHGAVESPLVAYFSAEFGLAECLSIFAGGLGVLAGDHLKSASDLGVPLVGVGLLYQQGYFRQYLNEAGWQQEAYEDNDFYNLPLTLEHGPDGRPLAVEVPYPGREVLAQIWRAQVGRVSLYLLDANVRANSPEDRNITHQLYGGDLEMRIKQDVMLGIGGFRALEALGIQPAVYHMNEGHSAFLALERVRCLMERGGLSFAEAREAASAGLIFTTHTPVAAGHDYFSSEQMDRYFGGYAEALGLNRQEFLALGRQDPGDDSELFSMTVLALRLSAYSNGVSRLHGEVNRRMWQKLWPGVTLSEMPIGHVTNGVHFQTWISREMDQLYERYLGPRWRESPGDQAVWQRTERISAEELWRARERSRERLVSFVRSRLRGQLVRQSALRREIEAADEVLDSEALTIGFARRFATYKRATLLIKDPERLARLVIDPDCPVQIVYAGKAHPRDDAGKELIRQIVELTRQERFRRRLVFLEEYDMAVARYLVQGVDVWLNTPLRPREASGTSGMKAAANGVLNLSVLDGWWDEAWRDSGAESDTIGWAIGRGETYDDPDYQDRVEAEALYNLLEQDVVPTFYDRGADGLPRRWIDRMKTSIGILCHAFNTHRMVREYTDRFYVPAAARHGDLVADAMARARDLAAWKARVKKSWPMVRIQPVGIESRGEAQVGGLIRAKARVHLGNLAPNDVAVELYLGRVDPSGELTEAEASPMELVDQDGDGTYLFEAGSTTYRKSGRYGYTMRVLPRHPDLSAPFLPGLIAWA